MRWSVLLGVLLAAVAAAAPAPVRGPVTPAEVVGQALTHARTLPADVARTQRYLSLHNVPPADRDEATRVLAFHLNGFGREPDLVPLTKAGADVLTWNLRDFGVDRFVYGRLGQKDPYFHVTLDVAGRRTVAAAPWLDAKAIGELIRLTQSESPVLRADWFFVQTAVQADRGDTGYYDFLGVGKLLADFDRLVGLDRKEAERLRLEQAAVVVRSGVGLNNRQVHRLQALTGGYWITLDPKANVGERNAIRQLDKTFVFDAQEVYGTLPNGLFAYFLADAAGNRADTAPDFIASDRQSTGNDARVHVARSCVVCHAEGLRPIDDYMRRVYRPPLGLTSPDYDTSRRLRQLYLSDLQEKHDADVSRFARALRRLNGLTPPENARAYGRFWDRYQEAGRTIDDLAREVGETPVRLRARLQEAGKAGGLDPILAGLLADPPEPLRAEHVEEVFPLLVQTPGGPP
jgi:hypothetical protein